MQASTTDTIFYVVVSTTIPASWSIGLVLYSLDRQSSGFLFQNNYVKSKGRGLLVKTTNGVIEGNHLEGGTAGVEVGPERNGADGGDAGVANNITIKNNRIVHTGYHETFDASYYGPDGAIAFFAYNSSTQTRPSAFQKILIQDNVFESVNGINIGITSTHNIVISGNQFLDTHPILYSDIAESFGFDNGYVVYLTTSKSINMMDNIVQGNGKNIKKEICM